MSNQQMGLPPIVIHGDPKLDKLLLDLAIELEFLF